MRRIYTYVGPKKIAERAMRSAGGVQIQSPEDVRRWICHTGQTLDGAGSVIATFVIHEGGDLRIADRRSEHVACASGKPVQSAGEMTFTVLPGGVSATWVTNQSTGYCPEPESWLAVEAALARTGIAAPEDFSRKFVFRRCPDCGAINIVKDEVFECGVCEAPLPAEWNFDSDAATGQISATPRSRGFDPV